MQDIKILKTKKLEDLRYIAKMMGIKSITKYRKGELIDFILEAGGKEEEKPVEAVPEVTGAEELPEVADIDAEEETVPAAGEYKQNEGGGRRRKKSGM